jgi:hypothetical protein
MATQCLEWLCKSRTKEMQPKTPLEKEREGISESPDYSRSHHSRKYFGVNSIGSGTWDSNAVQMRDGIIGPETFTAQRCPASLRALQEQDNQKNL